MLRVLDWDDRDTVLHLGHACETLTERLHWPDDQDDVDTWREQWASAFTVRHREVITTSQAMAVRLAELARKIRRTVNAVLEVESEDGPVRKLHRAFKEALIHDLSEDDFADMYAQTIAYGLLSARVSRQAGLVAEDMVHMVPVTNPFLKELLETFLHVGGRKHEIDFDELGVHEVVQLLRDANMEAVLRDFGDRNPQEDPVIHFYELFLKEYDPVKRIKRGVFYTPRPVVSFIVRSVDEILRTEFGLEDGLADTTTWGEMLKRHPDLKLPKHVKPSDPFVQILDPACGTGTFLVEVMNLVQRTMLRKWTAQGHREEQTDDLWNAYVSRHLLPRLYGFELLMAPYAIAHMKLGLKLYETGYRFGSDERVRIYLTNSLEPPHDFSGQFQFMVPALAHEAQAANQAKTEIPHTVVIGNPPYSVLSANLSDDARRLVDPFRYVDGEPIRERSMLRLEMHLQDDYVKFFRRSQAWVESASVGILGLITNNSYLDNLTLRGMRCSLCGSFAWKSILNLHGGRQKATAETRAASDQNVFDIEQGVAIFLGWRNCLPSPRATYYGDLMGTRDHKYGALLKASMADSAAREVWPKLPHYFLVPRDTSHEQEYERGLPITDAIGDQISGIITAHDALVIDFGDEVLKEKARILRDEQLDDTQVKEMLSIRDNAGWKVDEARRALRETVDDDRWFKDIAYRPFDVRRINYHPALIWCDRCRLMKHMIAGPNIALATCRQLSAPPWRHVLVARTLQDDCYISNKSKERSYLLPMYLYPESDSLLRDEEGSQVNLTSAFTSAVASAVQLDWVDCGRGDLVRDGTVGPQDIFHYIYAQLHSETYRDRYAEFLRRDFPRVFLTRNLDLFRALCQVGADLVALHLLEDDYEAASWEQSTTERPLAKATEFVPFRGEGGREVRKAGEKGKALANVKNGIGRVYINETQCFNDVPEDVWEFHIGSYQVCHKWLKDRRGRVLTDEDITHYQKIIVALSETIRLMAEIDKVIDSHGGWPDAFTTG